MESYSFSRAGKFHTERNMPNEDYVAILKDDDLVVSAITDGAGGKKAGKEAAQLIAPVIAEWIFDTFWEQYYRDGEVVRREAVQIINSRLKPYAQTHGIKETDLACTLIVAAMDSQGRCLCIHLGDGVILRRNMKHAANQADIVSTPENGATKNATFLTMNCNMWQHIRYCRWRNPDTECIITLSDGAQIPVVELDSVEGWLVTASCLLDEKSIVAHLILQSPTDDCSLAIISR